MVHISDTDNRKCLMMIWSNRNSLIASRGCGGYSCLGRKFGGCYKVKHTVTIQANSCALWYFPTWAESLGQKKNQHVNVNSSFVYNFQSLDVTKMFLLVSFGYNTQHPQLKVGRGGLYLTVSRDSVQGGTIMATRQAWWSKAGYFMVTRIRRTVPKRKGSGGRYGPQVHPSVTHPGPQKFVPQYPWVDSRVKPPLTIIMSFSR